ncbi:hypothetical protein PG994_012600 [Apiospora phragmitis]|uniref:Uncharacterized protein n=1 Tax=Apiospora phragmitis TaxID=2905665 RepID=A0ABR1TBI3_9PEZI
MNGLNSGGNNISKPTYGPTTPTSVRRPRGGHVTIRDNVTAVHWWLMGLREDLVLTAGDCERDTTLPSDTKLMVLVGNEPDTVDVHPDKEWLVESRSNPFPEHPSPPRRNPPPSPPPPDTTPVGGIDPRVERWNRERPPPGLLDAHFWPGI